MTTTAEREARSKRPIRRVTAAAGLLLLVSLAPARSGAVAKATDGRDAASYLERIARSGDDASYRAKEVVVYFGKPQSAAMVDVSVHSDQKFVRAEGGGRVTRVWRSNGSGVVQGADGSIEDASAPQVDMEPADVLAKYDVEIGRPQKMLGVVVVPLSLHRRSDGQIVERWLVHDATGVVYRRELYGNDGKLVGASWITDMDWGGGADAESFNRDAERPSQAFSVRVPGAPTRLADGYRLLGAYRITANEKRCEQWLYSDGLHALSVFTTYGGLRVPRGFTRTRLSSTTAWAGPGPGMWAWEGGGRTWVVVAEEPGLDPARLTKDFPQGGPSVLSRMGSLWARGARAIGGLFS